MRRTVPYLAALLATAAAVAQSASPAAGAAKLIEFERLEQRVGGSWLARWNAATNTPSAIVGSGLQIPDWRGNTLDEARRCALRVLQEQGDLLGLGSSEFREVVGARMGRTWSFTFEQFFRGVPCIGGRADVRVHASGVVSMLGSTAWPIPADFGVTPALASVEAEARAWLEVGAAAKARAVVQPGGERPVRLVVWGDLDAPTEAKVRLCWEVPIRCVDREGGGPVGRYYVDARTGAVLHYASDKHDCGFSGCTHEHHVERAIAPTVVTVLGYKRTGLSASEPLVNAPMVGLVVNVPGIGARTTDANGQFTIDIAAPVTIGLGALDGVHQSPNVDPTGVAPSASVTVQPGVPATLQLLSPLASDDQVAHTNVQHWLQLANEWARSILGNSNQLNQIDNVTPSVNLTGSCNAFYTGNTVNFYAAGGGCANTSFSTVIVHEWGHGLDDRYGGITNVNGEGLSEGWGDIVAMYLVDDPIVGRDISTGGFVRSGLNNTLYGSQFEVHAAGESWMGYAWRVRENLRASLGSQAAIAISNDIVLGTIVANARNQPDAVLETFLADDDDGNLQNGVPHYAQLSTAALAKGLPFPAIQTVVASHTPLTDTTQRLSPRLVRATVQAPGSGSIAQVRLVFQSGGLPVTRVMAASGLPNGYQAVLPGLDYGSMQYHLECQHSTGFTLRVPTVGEYRYSVTAPLGGAFVPIYGDDFESGAPGWTHGSGDGITPDDWQLGAPGGRGGNSLGVAWRDPNNAVSGTQCWGTDLGRNGGDGAYSANLVSWLRSPVIDCSNRTGVVLRFQRWLSVEQGSFDHAQVLVNGVPVYTNPQTGAVQDGAWQQFECALPMADGNPAVQIEWRLETDGGLQLGGWNLDDVAVGTRTILAPAASLTLLPEQANAGATMTYSVHTQGQQPFLALIGDAPGPSFVPGLPLLDVGGNGQALIFFTDASGQFQTSFPAPAIVGQGVLWYLQVLTFDAQGAVVASNPSVNLVLP